MCEQPREHHVVCHHLLPVCRRRRALQKDGRKRWHHVRGWSSGTVPFVTRAAAPIAPVAVAHGNISVSIKTENEAVPAVPFTDGEPVVQTNQTIEVNEEKRNLIEVEGANLSDVVEGLNRLGTTPRDLITILQAIKKAGALRASIEVM